MVHLGGTSSFESFVEFQKKNYARKRKKVGNLVKELVLLKIIDHRPLTTYPPTTFPTTYVKIEDQILNMFCIL